MAYFPLEESIHVKLGNQVEGILQTVANRYVGNNPAYPMTYRVYCAGGIERQHDYRYRFNMADRFPNMQIGQFVYAWSKLWSDADAELRFALETDCPARLYVNGGLVYRTTLMDENIPGYRANLTIKLARGWNHFVLRFIHTSVGCGGTFGTATFKSVPLHMLAPSKERAGQEGWIYSEPQDAEWEALPAGGEGAQPVAEAQTGLRWYPDMRWPATLAKVQPLQRIYGSGNCAGPQGERSASSHAAAAAGIPEEAAGPNAGEAAYAWTKLRNLRRGDGEFVISGMAHGPVTIYINGIEVFRMEGGEFTAKLPLRHGANDFLALCRRSGEGWGLSLQPLPEGLSLQAAHPVQGAPGPWLYLGPFAEGGQPDLAELSDAERMCSVFANASGGTFWRVDLPDGWVRPYAENPLFGRWNYPLGVTLYGLLETAGELSRQDLAEYVKRHIEACTTLYEYCLWDRDQFGASGVLHTLATLDSLDDCGSFGATMLLAHSKLGIHGAEPIGMRIAEWIRREQSRRPDGMLYRTREPSNLQSGTAWCDDLYMSVPFLCRYYRLTGDISCLHDAALQFKQYKQSLYMPQQQIMSHVIDYRKGKPTEIPWGRGNGWVLFSLSELLAELPPEDPHRRELIGFFRELCEGFLRLQGPNGLWHQVLNVPESYEETSCTSMFIYGFARGVRYGWLEETEPYVEAVAKAWEGLSRISIDRAGNVYGVCRGSGYSYTAAYYKDDLPWLLNDTHGIGIVLLAGIEVLRLESFFQEGQTSVLRS
ncbi:glycoside hydrolase family 88/105 protein [Paenibacillus turpanensis]|uniref:glycoside hydrolase family 88/105 protein n=1 Tax=Paenibacillus turpanensis TaxID=2689078 RepID=UPI0014092396|nr:glycoside hydrolase family 88 protein [Paenibacillus turpanensis]